MWSPTLGSYDEAAPTAQLFWRLQPLHCYLNRPKFTAKRLLEWHPAQGATHYRGCRLPAGLAGAIRSGHQASITPARAQSDRPWRQPPRPAPPGISAGTEGCDTLVRVDTFRLTGYPFNHLLPRRTRHKAPAGLLDGSKIFS